MTLQHIILGLLKAEGAKSGYDLKQMIDRTTQNFWYCDHSQIYRALSANEKAGWVQSEVDLANPHNRKMYHITPTGETALKMWIMQDSEFEPMRSAQLARLFFGSYVDVEHIKTQIRRYRQYQVELVAHYRHLETFLEGLAETQAKQQPYWMITLQQGLFIGEAYIKWCDDALERLEERQEHD